VAMALLRSETWAAVAGWGARTVFISRLDGRAASCTPKCGHMMNIVLYTVKCYAACAFLSAPPALLFSDTEPEHGHQPQRPHRRADTDRPIALPGRRTRDLRAGRKLPGRAGRAVRRRRAGRHMPQRG